MRTVPGIAIWWLRRDLRLADNPALRYALDHAGMIVPVYIHAPDEEDEWPLHFPQPLQNPWMRALHA